MIRSWYRVGPLLPGSTPLAVGPSVGYRIATDNRESIPLILVTASGNIGYELDCEAKDRETQNNGNSCKTFLSLPLFVDHFSDRNAYAGVSDSEIASGGDASGCGSSSSGRRCWPEWKYTPEFMASVASERGQ